MKVIERNSAAGAAMKRGGSGTLGLCHVANGSSDAYAELHINAWDVAAGIVIANGSSNVQATAEEVLDLPITLRAPASLRGKQPVTFVVASDDGKTVREVESSFFGPM